MTKKQYIQACIMALVMLVSVVFAVAAAEKKVEITLWHHWTGPERIAYVQKMLDEFNELYPWIEAKQLSAGTGGAQERLMTFIISGASPEVVQVMSGYGLPIIAQGGFLPLNEFAERDNLNLRIFNSVDLAPFQYKDATYALPITSGVAWTNLMIYNKRLMAEVGLNPNAPPETWEQWRIAARRMTRKTGDGVLERAGTSIPPVQTVNYWNNGSLWTDDLKTAQTDTPAMHETIEFLKELSDEIYGGFNNYAPWINSHQFQAEHYGIWIQNNSVFNVLKDVPFEWGAKLAPVGPQPGAKPTGLVLSTWAYAIPVTVPKEKQEAAWLLLSWLTTKPESAGWFTRVQGRPSAVTTFNSHPEYLRSNPSWNVVIEAVNYDMAIPPGVDVWNRLMEPSNWLLAGQVSPKQGLTAMDMVLQEMLDTYWSVVGD
ncbi:MAG TPA: extracellular solute-binding protein [Firmicutes bacterium]|jgi:sn-glycerol 3-phosphate transport system substrate-binding protein|nr:extracellular solute-binding protein [Bacillota bacterium]